MRRSLVLSLPLLLGAAAPRLPDVNEAGRVAATLSDWQTMVFFLAFIIVVLLIFITIQQVQSYRTNKMLSDAIDRLATVSGNNAGDIKVTLALIQQTLQTLNRHDV